jgi:hypothetical protein
MAVALVLAHLSVITDLIADIVLYLMRTVLVGLPALGMIANLSAVIVRLNGNHHCSAQMLPL